MYSNRDDVAFNYIVAEVKKMVNLENSNVFGLHITAYEGKRGSNWMDAACDSVIKSLSMLLYYEIANEVVFVEAKTLIIKYGVIYVHGGRQQVDENLLELCIRAFWNLFADAWAGVKFLRINTCCISFRLAVDLKICGMWVLLIVRKLYLVWAQSYKYGFFIRSSSDSDWSWDLQWEFGVFEYFWNIALAGGFNDSKNGRGCFGGSSTSEYEYSK